MMDKKDRSKRIHFLAQYIPESLEPVVGVYFGEHVIRVNGQLCLVVDSTGAVGVRALTEAFSQVLSDVCEERHWSAHGRVYDQWYLLPDDFALNDARLKQWIAESATAVFERSQHGNIPNRQASAG